MKQGRFPNRVYGHGTEPDPRFSLANERTFLAWIRTSLALVAAGIALEALQLPIRTELRLVAALVFVALGPLSIMLGLAGLVLVALAWLGAQRRYLKANRDLTGTEAALGQGGLPAVALAAGRPSSPPPGRSSSS